MNIVINGKCSKNCSFCFETPDFKKKTENMTLEKFEEVVDWIIQSYGPGALIPISLCSFSSFCFGAKIK